MLAIIFALVSAALNAASAVLQREVIGTPKMEQLFGRGLFRKILRNRKWFLGLGLQVVGFLFQAAAFYTGALVLVAPIMTSDLVFLLLLLSLRSHISPGRREWAAVAAICLGLSGLLVLMRPHSPAQFQFYTAHWLIAVGIIVLLMAASAVAVRRIRAQKWRAGLLAVSAGLSYALVAACVKLTGHAYDQGLLHIFTSWPVYALLVAGILSIIMQQNTYGAGPLAISQPAMEITELLGDVLLGIMIFGEIVHAGASAIAGEVLCGLVVAMGIILLGGSRRVYQTKM